MTEDRASLQLLLSKIATVTVALREWHKLATESTKKLKVAKADVVLQLSLQEAALDEVGAHTTEVAELLMQLETTNAEISQLSAEHVDLIKKLCFMKLQHAAGNTMSDGLKSVVGAGERLAKRAKMSRFCRKFSATPLKAASPALLTERDYLKKSL